MKKRMEIVGLLLLVLTIAVQADDFAYTTDADNTITITEYTGPGGDVTIPDTINGLPVTSIGNWAFQECTSLTNIIFPDSVTNIGLSALAGCASLTNVMIGAGVTSIGEQAFYCCTNLTSVTIPDSVTSIGDWAFRFCTGLTSVTISDGVTSIGVQAFSDCYSLTSIIIPDSVTSIGQSAFTGCTSLNTITVDDFNSVYSSTNGVLFNKNQNALIRYPEGKVGSYTIPNSVTGIANWAFDSCTSLTSVTIPNSVTSIEDGAFGNCTSLTNVTIGRGVTSIGNDAFYSCCSLTSITIPDSVTGIGQFAFIGCTSLNTITVDDLNSVYSSTNGVLFDKNQTALIRYPEGKAGIYTIQNSVTGIANWAFYSCTSLASITIPNSVTSIGNGAFGSCTSLTNFIIGSGVANIGAEAFHSCTNLTSVTIPNGVTSIGDWAFRFCTGLTSVTIHGSVTSIGVQAFSDCYSLTRVTLGTGVTSIADSAFSDCYSLTRVTIGTGITNIADYAFYSCYSLTGVYFEGNAPSVGWWGVFPYNATVYRVADATGWPIVPNSWADCPTALWDSDADGISDPWEERYFGNPTNANPNAYCSSGINTMLEAYIAGLNPNDPQSALRVSVPSNGKVLGWNAVSGRVYNVYWTTNLLTSGFQCLESNIPWTRTSFTNPASVPCGYYKIDVRLK